MKYLLSWVLTSALLCLAVTAYADTGLVTEPVVADAVTQEVVNQSAVQVAAPSAVLLDATTGTVLYAKDENTMRAPASVTKIMTMLLVLEEVEKGALKFDDLVTASQNAKELGGTQINLDIGEQMTVYDLMMAVAVASANDAAMALAEHVGGSASGFMKMMNDRAADLGMTNTTFQNPHGLPEEGHMISALDIGKMTAALLNMPSAVEFIGCETYTIRQDTNPYQMRTTNKLLGVYDGCVGGKTGYTDEAGYCMGVGATREGLTLVAVVMGEVDSETRQQDLITLFDYGFGAYTTYDISIEPISFEPIPIQNGMVDTVEIVVPKMILPPVIIEKGSTPQITQEITVTEQLQAPVEQGDEVGDVVIRMNGQEIAQFALLADQSVQVRSVGAVLLQLLQQFVSL